MQVVLKTHLKHSGQVFESGSVLALPDELAEELITAGSAQIPVPEGAELLDEETRLGYEDMLAAKDRTIEALSTENEALREQVESYLAAAHPDGRKAQALIALEATETAVEMPAELRPAESAVTEPATTKSK